MADIPLALSLPAAAGGLAYLNGKLGFTSDLPLIKGFLGSALDGHLSEFRDRLNVFYNLESHALHKTRSKHPFIVYQGKTWTYGEAYQTVLRHAAWMKKRWNIGKGEVVAMDLPNSDTFVWLWFALWSLGAKPAFINYNLTGQPLLHSIKTSGARLVFIDPDVQASFTDEVREKLSEESFREGGRGNVEMLFYTPEIQREIATEAPWRAPDDDRAGQKQPDMALLIYTSGTTGLPKPAIVSWNKCHMGGYFVQAWLPLRQKESRFYTCMPLYHSSAAILGLCSTLFAGSTIIVGRKFSASNFFKEARENKATVIQYVGETCRYLLAVPPSPQDKQHHVHTAFGNGMRPDVWDQFKERYGIETVAEFYAMTEGPSAMWNLSRNDFSSGAVGKFGFITRQFIRLMTAHIALDFESGLPIRDPKTGFCRQTKPGEPGEVVYKLDPQNIEARFQGYYGNQGATSKKIYRDVFSKGDAYFSSGDAFRCDDEGRYYFLDRLGDTFRWKSENVSTAEVGAVLGTSEHISEANVYGVQLPKHDGRAGCAAITTKSGKIDDKMLKDLAKHVGKNLPRYAQPLFLRYQTDSLKHQTGTNKQQKHVLREEGVDPKKVAAGGCVDQLYWLDKDQYKPFTESDWGRLEAGKLKL